MAVIGDLHGRADLLEQIIEQIAAQVGSDLPLVFVGDFIDRGENSAEVLGLLQRLQASIWPAEVVCLMGNHEAMMLDFLDAPAADGGVWLRNGGVATLASYGIPLLERTSDALHASRDGLRAALGDGTEAWLRTLPLSHRSGNVFVAHAGADPHAPLDQQHSDHLLWGHPEFITTARGDGVWVAHGHMICPQPSATEGRISVDTGAYATHRLTAALLADGGCQFLSTG